MRKLYVFCLLLLFTISPKLYATHIFGGDLLYTHITGNTYRVSLVLYGDCGAAQSTFESLYVSTPEIIIYDGNDPNPVISMTLVFDTTSGTEVSPVCPAQVNNTTCNNGTLPGIKKFVYSRDTTLPHTSANWQFIFTGRLSGLGAGAGRSSNITNINQSAQQQQLMYLIATLNNVNGPNSSPVYTTIPTPFYCINIAQQYNQGASDPDNDVLTFEMTPGLVSGTPVSYVPPYTAQQPMAASYFNFNTLNGQMSFLPNLVQNSLLVNRVLEYKNGVQVGSSMREMTFIVLDNCQNQPPVGNVDTTTLQGGLTSGDNVINVCYGTPAVSFNINPSDANLENITITTNNVPNTATLTLNNNNSSTPSVTFNWNIVGLPVGAYTFYINYKDDGCPLASSQTVAYTIRIADPYTISAQPVSLTNCYSRAAVQYTLSDGVVPRTITVMQGNNLIKTITDTSGTVIDSLNPGTYTIQVSSPYFACDTSISLTISDSGHYPVPPAVPDTFELCLQDKLIVDGIGYAPNGTLQWLDSSGNLLPGPPTLSAITTGIYTWYVSQLVNVCMSDTVKVLARVNENPEVQILNQPGKVCYADKIYLEVTGADSYTWSPSGFVARDDKGEYIIIRSPVTVRVTGTNAIGCSDKDSITYNHIEKCCNFAYPNAFTPNGDGKNERFRPVMYGNMEQYELTIFNRFGQRIYYTEDATKGWDGTYKGTTCDIGTYYFMVKALCYTGQREEHSDAVQLLR